MKLITLKSAMEEWQCSDREAMTRIAAMVAGGELEYAKTESRQTWWEYTGNPAVPFRTCVRCSKSFSIAGMKHSQKYCSKKCQRGATEKKVCPVCDKEFDAQAYSSRKYCGRNCEFTSRSKQDSPRKNFGDFVTDGTRRRLKEAANA